LPDTITVTLVGTGGPELSPNRSGPATLIQANGQSLLVDAGRNTLDGLYLAHVLPQTVTRIFLTHLHSDHIAGLPDLWITPWFLLGRTAPLELWGPPGTQAMVDGMRQMYAHDLANRPNAALPRAALDITVHEIAPGLIYTQAGLTVTATAVEHADGDPAFAYRIQTPTHSVFLTGDCTLTPALAQAAHGVDLLIANVAAATPALEATPRLQPILAKLLRPEQAAELFQQAQPRLAVYAHIVKKDLLGLRGDAVLLARTRRAGYKGPLCMGHDHERIVIAARIRIQPPQPPPSHDLDGPSSTLP
jgi:ribonuclease Z